METLISESVANPNDPRRKELEQMENQKAMIDLTRRPRLWFEENCIVGWDFWWLKHLGS